MKRRECRFVNSRRWSHAHLSPHMFMSHSPPSWLWSSRTKLKPMLTRSFSAPGVTGTRRGQVGAGPIGAEQISCSVESRALVSCITSHLPSGSTWSQESLSRQSKGEERTCQLPSCRLSAVIMAGNLSESFLPNSELGVRRKGQLCFLFETHATQLSFATTQKLTVFC